MPAFRSPDPVILKERFLARVRGLDQLNPADRCYAVRGMVRESWAIRGCDVADVFRSAWGDATGQTHWKRWFAEGVCRVGDFAEMIAVLATEGAENAAWRKIAVLCCLRNGVEKGKIRVTSGDPAALMAITERTHPASTAVWQEGQPIDLNAAKIDMDEAADWLGAAGRHLLPESLRRFLENTARDRAGSTPSEVLTIKPTIYGVGIDLKEAGRRLRRRVQKWRGKSE
jgi:hypothetical protein